MIWCYACFPLRPGLYTHVQLTVSRVNMYARKMWTRSHEIYIRLVRDEYTTEKAGGRPTIVHRLASPHDRDWLVTLAVLQLRHSQSLIIVHTTVLETPIEDYKWWSIERVVCAQCVCVCACVSVRLRDVHIERVEWCTPPGRTDGRTDGCNTSLVVDAYIEDRVVDRGSVIEAYWREPPVDRRPTQQEVDLRAPLLLTQSILFEW